MAQCSSVAEIALDKRLYQAQRPSHETGWTEQLAVHYLLGRYEASLHFSPVGWVGCAVVVARYHDCADHRRREVGVDSLLHCSGFCNHYCGDCSPLPLLERASEACITWHTDWHSLLFCHPGLVGLDLLLR